MAKQTPMSLTGAVSDMIDVVCIASRTCKNTALKVEKVVDIAGDGCVSAVTAFDSGMRNYAETIKAQAKL